jgi:hypothetical protein
LASQSSLRPMVVRTTPAASDPTRSCAPIQYLRNHTAGPFPQPHVSRQDPVRRPLGQPGSCHLCCSRL